MAVGKIQLWDQRFGKMGFGETGFGKTGFGEMGGHLAILVWL